MTEVNKFLSHPPSLLPKLSFDSQAEASLAWMEGKLLDS